MAVSVQSSQRPEEHPQIVIYRSIRSRFLSLVAVFALTAASIYVSSHYPWSMQYIDIGAWLGVSLLLPLPLFSIVPLAFLAQIVHSLLDYRYILCDDYVLGVEGLLSLKRKSIRINYVHIRGMEIDESLWQQVLRVGDLTILATTLDQGEHLVTMRGIANPRRIKDLIQARVHEQVQGTRLAVVVP
jgi:uncharacterized membrane protein YdbT with pleckstrin-like domain